jgi:hypothetical protein
MPDAEGKKFLMQADEKLGFLGADSIGYFASPAQSLTY